MRLLTGIGFFFLLSTLCTGQGYPLTLSGTIRNYDNQPVILYECHGDTLLRIDSARTEVNGKFLFSIKETRKRNLSGLFKVVFEQNQFFYFLNDGSPVEIRTVYAYSPFYNIATDSLVVLKSTENKRFFEFQDLQKKLNVANYFLLKMMRLYPLYDSFHQQIVQAFMQRNQAMDQLVKVLDKDSGQAPGSAKVARAYYQPVIPDWKEPDQWRDSIIASHYFEYFDPADSFYLSTNILPEKMDLYLSLRTNKRDGYGQPLTDESFSSDAASDFVKKTISNNENYRFCLNYFLKKFNKEHKEKSFLTLYDTFLRTQDGDCGSTEADDFTWARKKAGVLRGIQVGSMAPDFSLQDGTSTLSSIQSEYTLLIFWATWCPHCVKILPEIRNITGSLNLKYQVQDKPLVVVAVSLDTEKAVWQKYLEDNRLLNWINNSELRGWKGLVPTQYNVYATPTLFLLDKEKKIIAKPESVDELKKILETIK